MRAQRFLAAALACLTLAACGNTVDGRPSATSPPAAADASATLGALLETAPSGSQSWGNAWADASTPSVEQFVSRVYAPADQVAEAARLRAQGIVAIAHRTWTASDTHQADLVLLQFATAAGATARLRTAVAAKSRVANIREFDVPNYPGVVGLYPPGIDDDGNYRAIVYAQKSSIVMELFYYCPEPFNASDAITWAVAQLQLLP
ncbi:MAG TPA: hypothetical protein VGN35_07875 [Jatrophihabitantaceae bacterium]|nr:hypothetical protein [Jatrophihabitantaceae bacterium]